MQRSAPRYWLAWKWHPGTSKCKDAEALLKKARADIF
jgi:hypothetical protein